MARAAFTSSDKDTLSVLSGVLGTDGDSVDPKAVWAKYSGLQIESRRFLRVLAVLRDSTLAVKFPAQAAALGAYIARLEANRAAAFAAPDLAEKYRHPLLDIDFAAVTPDDARAFMAAFAAAKTCELVTAVLATCKTLAPYKGELRDPKALSDRYLRGGGLTFAPIAGLPELNLKELYLSPKTSAEERRLLLHIVHKLHAVGWDLYNAASAPEIDVEAFSLTVRGAIGEIKKKIPRCDEAFSKLAESLDLLETNFGSYYKDFIATDNPSIIMENFVLDVSRTSGASPRIASQFKKIIEYYRRAQRSDDPKLRAIFSAVDRNIQELEKSEREGPANSPADADGGAAAADGAATVPDLRSETDGGAAAEK